MDRQKELTITPAAWTDGAAQAFARIKGPQSAEEVRREVQAGAQLFEVYEGDSFEPCMYYALRIDQVFDGPEGVVFAAAGDLPGVDLTMAVLPAIEQQFKGCSSIRIHTARPGLARKLVSIGWGGLELVLRKSL